MSDHLEYNEFIQSFKTRAQELEDVLSQAATGKALDTNAIDQLSLSITKLRSTVTEAVAVGILPAYDQRLCEQRVASLEGSLSKTRSTSKPKSKFSFKSARPTPAATAPPVERSFNPSETTPGLGNPIATASTTEIALNDHTGRLLTVADATGLQVSDGSSPAQSVVINVGGLTDCFVDLASTESFTVNALHVQGLKRTVLYAGNVQGSVLLHDCVGCTIIVSAHQFRMHTSSATNVYLKISSNPVVEKCSGIRFGPFPQLASTDTVGSHDKLEKSTNTLPYVVQDFDWIGTGQSPNWSSIGTAPFRRPINVLNENLDSTLDEMLPKTASK